MPSHHPSVFRPEFLWILVLLVVVTGCMPKKDAAEGLTAYNEGRFVEAYTRWLPAAESGNAEAQYYLSLLHRRGQGVVRDDAKALEYLHRAAEGGYMAAQFNLGNHYNLGEWVAQDYAQALHWWTLAANQGFLQAQYNLGSMYLLGRGVPKDLKQARYWYGQAADGGSQVARQLLDTLDKDASVNHDGWQSSDGQAGQSGVDTDTADSPEPTSPENAAGVGVNPQLSAGGETLLPMVEQTVVSEPAMGVEPAAVVAESEMPSDAMPALAAADAGQTPLAAVTEHELVQDADADPAELEAGDDALPANLDIGSRWLLLQPAEHYTLQLFASNQAGAAENFVGRHRFARQLAVFPFIRAGSVWHAAVYGRFTDTHSARAAIAELPPAVRDSGPWPRRIGEIQELIRASR